MIDDAGAAPAAAEPVAPSQDGGSAAAQPDTGARQAEPVIDRSKETARASIDRAFAEIDREKADAGPGKAKDQPVADGRERDEHGRFKAKDAQPGTPTPEQQQPDKVQTEQPETDKAKGAIGEAPSRFSADAKAAWATVPDAVKGEVHRALRELETGLGQYQQAFEPLKPYFQMAQKHETTVHDALARYTSLDLALHGQDAGAKHAAIRELIEYAGFSPQEYAALVMGQKPDQTQAQSAAEVRQLKADLAEMRQLLGGVSTTLQQSRQSQFDAMVETFAKDHPRLSDAEFMKTVIRLIDTKMADDLPSAYDMAERLIPAPVKELKPAASTAAISQKPSDQTRKGNMSIAGAPVSGSNPTNRKPASTARESLDRVFAEMGLSG